MKNLPLTAAERSKRYRKRKKEDFFLLSNNFNDDSDIETNINCNTSLPQADKANLWRTNLYPNTTLASYVKLP